MSMRSEEIFDTQWSDVNIEVASHKYDRLWSYLPTDIKNIVDVGGGVGAMCDSLKGSSRKAVEYLLIDSSKAAVNRAGQRGVLAILHDLEDGPLPLEDNSVDCVCFIDVLEHLRNPWVVLAEGKRISRKYVFVHGPNFAYWRSRLDTLLGNPNRQMVVDKYGGVIDGRGRQVSHIYYMTYHNLLHWGNKIGLEVEKKRVYWYRRYAMFRWFLEPLFGNWGSQYQIVFKKTSDVEKVEKPS